MEKEKCQAQVSATAFYDQNCLEEVKIILSSNSMAKVSLVPRVI